MRNLSALVWVVMTGVLLGADSGLDAYRVISERNIFNPNRGVRQRPANVADTRTPSPPPSDRVTLAGVAVFAGEPSAVFVSNTAALGGKRPVGDVLDSLTLTAVDISGVVMTAGDSEFRLSVGDTIARSADGSWQATDEAVVVAAPSGHASSDSDSGSSATSSNTSSGDKGGAEDMLQQLRERRQQELNK